MWVHCPKCGDCFQLGLVSHRLSWEVWVEGTAFLVHNGEASNTYRGLRTSSGTLGRSGRCQRPMPTIPIAQYVLDDLCEFYGLTPDLVKKMFSLNGYSLQVQAITEPTFAACTNGDVGVIGIEDHCASCGKDIVRSKRMPALLTPVCIECAGQLDYGEGIQAIKSACERQRPD